MFRRSVFVTAILFLFAAKFSSAQDTILASEVLKIWEKTAIKNAKFRIEEIRRRFADSPSTDPFDTPKPGEPIRKGDLIKFDHYTFMFSKDIGMKVTGGPEGVSNVMGELGLSVTKNRVDALHTAVLNKKGDTSLESLAMTDAVHYWLDPRTARYTKGLRELGDKKLPITKDKAGNERVLLQARRPVMLAKEHDWHVIQIDPGRMEDTPPLYEFTYERNKEGMLILKSCVFTRLTPTTKELDSSSEWSITDLDLSEIKEKDIAIDIPAPSLVHDYTVTPANEYFLRKDGSKTPYSSAEHYNILDEIKAEKAKAESK
jgi:hypothetical protein